MKQELKQKVVKKIKRKEIRPLKRKDVFSFRDLKKVHGKCETESSVAIISCKFQGFLSDLKKKIQQLIHFSHSARMKSCNEGRPLLLKAWQNLKTGALVLRSKELSLCVMTRLVNVQVYTFFEWFKLFVLAYWHLIVKSAGENHIRNQKLQLQPIKGEYCGLVFENYQDLKRYQQKVRLITFSTSSTLACVLIVVTLIQVFFPGGFTHGATFHFQQTNWSSQSANVANHNANQTDWSQYASIDPGVAIVNGGEDVQLQQATVTTTQTSDADFNAGTKTDTAVTGSGSGASVALAQVPVKINEYTVGILSNITANASGVSGSGPWLVSFSGAPNLSRIFKNDLFTDAQSKKWKVLSVSVPNKKIVVWDSESNGGAPATGIGTVGRWYTSLSTWASGRQGDLLARNAIERALPYYDGSPGTTSVFTINTGWTTDVDHYGEIYVPLSERHHGVWDDNKYRVELSDSTYGIDLMKNFRVDGLQIRASNSSIASVNRRGISIAATGVHISNCIIQGTSSVALSSSAKFYGINLYGGGGGNKIWNNIIYGFTSGSSDANDSFRSGINFSTTGSGTASYVYNNTLYGNNVGIYGDVSMPLNPKNNISYNNFKDYAYDAPAGFTNTSNNISKDATSPDAALRNKTVAFVDEANKNFHLHSNDLAAKNAGVDLSADADLPVAMDIDGNTRSGTWDVGADDAGATYEHVNSIGTASRDFTTLQAWEDARGGNLVGRNVFKTTGQSAAFSAGETITGGTSGATGVYIPERATPSASEAYMSLDNVTGTFQAGETLIGGTSGSTVMLQTILTVSGTIEKGEIYNDATYSAGVTIAGSTVDANHYMLLIAESRSRSGQVAGRGAQIVGVAGTVITASDAYTVIDGIEITGWTGNNNHAINASPSGTIRNNLIHDYTGTGGDGIHYEGIGNAPTFYNNIIYNITNSNAIKAQGSGVQVNAYNNTFYGSATGLRTENGNQNDSIKNNIAMNVTTGFSGSFGDSTFANYNMSSDATAPGANAVNNEAVANMKFASTDANLLDLHIQYGSVAQNAGANLNAIFKIDADQQTRASSGNWSIGADEEPVQRNYYKSSGEFESSTVDILASNVFKGVSVTPVNQPAATKITLHAAVSDNPAGPWSYMEQELTGMAKKIFYSVGQNTDDHKTGSPTVDISSGIATFSVAQTATNMGVGDKITYNGSSVAYISGKISQTQWTVITVTGNTPANVTGQTVNAIAHAFSSITQVAAGIADASHLNTTNLVAGNYQVYIPCYYDSGADSITSASFSNLLTTSSTNYVQVYTPFDVVKEVNQSQRHMGVWDNEKYRITATSASYGILLSRSNIKIKGLQIEMTSNSPVGGAIQIGTVQNCEISGNILRWGQVGIASSGSGIDNASFAEFSDTKINNNVIYGFKYGIFLAEWPGSSGYKTYATNNTIVNVTTGYSTGSDTTGWHILRNNIVQSTGSSYVSSSARFLSTENNISSDATSPNSGATACGGHSCRSQTVSFVDVANNDFHLSPSDAIAQDAGTWNGPAQDIDGSYRTDTWDIGADEVNGSAEIRGRYFRYKIYLSTTDALQSPTVDDVTFSYYGYPSQASLVSSPYDSTDIANVLAKVQWIESLNAGTDVTFQVRTSPDGNAWTSWMGPDGTNSTEFTDPAGGEAMPAAVTSGSNDRYLQYKAILKSNGSSTPMLSSVDVTYVVNASPQIQNVVAIQNADGMVTVNYEAKDSDTMTGASHGFATTSLQYCSASCDNPGSETWTNATTVGGNLGSIAVQENAFLPYTATWNPKEDYPNQFTAATKVRIVINDGEAANNISYGESAAFTLDTKNPTNVSITIDGRTKDIALSVPTDDSSPYTMEISNFADFRDATPEAFATSKHWPTLTSDPATVYVRIADGRNNKTTVSTTTPQKPKNIVYFDISNIQTEEYREFIAWSVVNPGEVGAGFESYEIERREDSGSFNSIDSQIDREANFLMDNNLTSGTSYSYRAYTQDTAGNFSAYSDVVTDMPNGQGGSDTMPPIITNVQVSAVTPTTATVTWTTDEMSDSSVGFSVDESYAQELGSGSVVTSHSITLTNLSPTTTYNIRIKSRDIHNNSGQVDALVPGSNAIENFAFTTLPGPKVSNIIVKEVNNTDAIIEWKTDVDADSKVNFSQIVSNGVLVSPQGISDSNKSKTHQIKLTSLTENTRYYFEVVSEDDNNNITADNNGGDMFELLTTQDAAAPQVQNMTLAYVASDAAVISFTTNELAKVTVNYGISSKNLSQIITTFDRSHTIFLSRLTQDETYTYAITVSDINGNQSTTNDDTFTTARDTEFDHEPLSEISDIKTPVLTDTDAVINFTTDQLANCFVEYGTTSGTYDAVPKRESDTMYALNHSMHLLGLLFQTAYFYKITCEDNLDTIVSSNEQTFTTKEKLYTESAVGILNDRIAPAISNVAIADVTGESVRIAWNTDEKGSSLVRYGVASVDENGAVDSVVNKSAENYVTAHEVNISGLIPATKYILVVSSTDEAGNIAESSESSFTTASPSSLSSIKAISRDLGQATITWETSSETTSIVEYGLTTSYGEVKQSNTRTKKHEIELSSLNQNEVYHYRVKGGDKNGRLYASADQTFEPKSPPKITEVNVNDVTEHGVLFVFTTNVPTDANVVYTNVQDKSDTGSQGKPDLGMEHRINLQNLDSGKTYQTKIIVRDEQGTQNELTGPDFTTGKDENPPKIDQVRTDAALTQSDKVQVIISWKTDEQSSSMLLYKEGRNGKQQEIRVSDAMATNHVAVVTFFKPGTSYYFNVKSVDASGNEAISNDFALLTPRRRENIIQIIINNFQDIFWWARR